MKHTAARVVTIATTLAIAGATVAQGDQGRQLTADLIAQLSGHASADRAMAGLLARGKEVAPALGKFVAEAEEPARSRALLVLRQLGIAAVEVVPHLLKALELCDASDAPPIFDAIADTTLTESRASQAVMDRMHRATDRLLQAADKEAGMAIRHGFVRALARMHFASTSKGALFSLQNNFVLAREYGAEQGGLTRSEEFLPSLRALLEDPDPPKRGGMASAFGIDFATTDRVLMKAAWAVERITGEHFENVHRHRYWLRYGGLQNRLAAVLALSQNPRYAEQSMPDLIAALSDPSPRVIGEAITALGLIGTAAEDATPKLEELAARPNRQIATRAEAALRQIR